MEGGLSLIEEEDDAVHGLADVGRSRRLTLQLGGAYVIRATAGPQLHRHITSGQTKEKFK